MKAKHQSVPLMKYLKEKGGIEKITYAAEVPTIKQAYEISRKRNKSSQDPFKTLIDKQQKRWFHH